MKRFKLNPGAVTKTLAQCIEEGINIDFSLPKMSSGSNGLLCKSINPDVSMNDGIIMQDVEKYPLNKNHLLRIIEVLEYGKTIDKPHYVQNYEKTIIKIKELTEKK